MFSRRHYLRFLVPVIASGMFVLSATRLRAADDTLAVTVMPNKAKQSADTGAVKKDPDSGEVQWGQVSGENVNIRSGPGVKNPIVTTMHAGDYVKAHAGLGGWIEIQWPESAPGWVLKDQVQITADGGTEGSPGTVKSVVMRVFSQGTARSTQIAKLERGAKVVVLGEDGDWLKIKPPESARAYISAKYVVTGVAAPDVNAARNSAILAKSRTTNAPVDVVAIETETAARPSDSHDDDRLRKEAELKKAQDAETARLLVETQRKAEAEEQARKEAEAKRVQEAETARIAAEAKRKAEAEEQARKEAEAKRVQEAETARIAAEAKRKAEAEEQARKEAEAKRVQEAETARIAAEAKRKAEAEEQARKEAEAKRVQEAETARIAAEAKRKAEAEEQARKEAEAKRAQEAETARLAAETKRKADAEAETARLILEAKKKAEIEERARLEAEARRTQEAEIARLAMEARQKAEADELARKEAESRRIADIKRQEDSELARLAAIERKKSNDEELSRKKAEDENAKAIAEIAKDTEKNNSIVKETARRIEEVKHADESVKPKEEAAEAVVLPPVAPSDGIAHPVNLDAKDEFEDPATPKRPAPARTESSEAPVIRLDRLPEPRIAPMQTAKRVKGNDSTGNSKAPIIIDDDEPLDTQPTEKAKKNEQSLLPTYERMADAGNRVNGRFVIPNRSPVAPAIRAEIVNVPDSDDEK